MPTTPMKNLLYRAALPVLSPSPKGQMSHTVSGHPIAGLAAYEKLLARHLTAQDDARLLDDLLEKAGAGNGN